MILKDCIGNSHHWQVVVFGFHHLPDLLKFRSGFTMLPRDSLSLIIGKGIDPIDVPTLHEDILPGSRPDRSHRKPFKNRKTEDGLLPFGF